MNVTYSFGLISLAFKSFLSITENKESLRTMTILNNKDSGLESVKKIK